MRVLVTGASGFVGAALVQHMLRDPSVHIIAASREPCTATSARVESVRIGDLGPRTEWQEHLAGAEVVVHLAARVHVMHDVSIDPLADFRRVNVGGTLNLARQALAAGARRFIHISSIKVNGESTVRGRPFRADDWPLPKDPYGISKYEAEQGLHRLAAATSLEVVVVRPPLVYGPGVRGNFRTMMDWIIRGVPLPLGSIKNRRSLVGLDNLCDLIATCTRHSAAAGQSFLAGDGEDVSTSELLRRLSAALGHPARLLPVPTGFLRGALTIFGKRDIGERLCSSLQVDIDPTRARLGWSPPVSLDEGLRRAAQAYLAEI